MRLGRWLWMRGGRCMSCGRRWRLRRLSRPLAPERYGPAPAVEAWAETWRTGQSPAFPGPDDDTRFDLIRHHPYLGGR
jgi:hypothetical protein